jgi:drug/metabolite transporter (DMT)-like permease
MKFRRRGALLAFGVPLLLVTSCSFYAYFNFPATVVKFAADFGSVLAFTGAMAALAHHIQQAQEPQPPDRKTRRTWDWFMKLSLGVTAAGALFIGMAGGAGVIEFVVECTP